MASDLSITTLTGFPHITAGLCASDVSASTFLDRFSKAVQENGERTALEFEGDVWTYADLSKAANRIANWLDATAPQSASSNGQRFVGLCLDRSHHAIAAMIGVMASGAAFVPLDPEYPQERLAWMIQDAGIDLVICEAGYRDLFSNAAVNLVAPDHQDILSSSAAPTEFRPAPGDLAYMMYTSGSTGLPKGVLIEHAALATYCEADIEAYKLTASDRALQFSTLCFDIAVEEIFPPLLVGATVVPRPRQRAEDENELSSLVEDYGITVLRLATAYWHEWVDLMDAIGQRVPSSLRMVLATGEKVSTTHYQRWLSLCDHEVLWCNAYGPTECTVTSTVFIPPPGWNETNMPIGKPLLGYEAFILDDQDRPLGVGETGHLYISGPALARGYLNRPEKTASAFRVVDLPDRGPTRIYRTGDLARWLEDGNIDFSGRVDHQIKLGSYRVEPGEIEFHVNKHPSVLESLVTCEESAGRKFLVAFVATGGQVLNAHELADFLRAHVPAHMLPTQYCFCDQFPKTINGKIDRRALPDSTNWQSPREREIVDPRDEIESLLVQIWSEVLGLESIGIEDDFFALGGSSLLVTRVIARIRHHYELAIPVRDFFANPTVESIARLLRARLGIESSLGEDDSRRLRDRQPDIEPFFFAVGGRRLFAIRYPGMGTSHRGWGVVFCEPEGHEYARAHANIRHLAARLAQLGFDALRFDYTNQGNSEILPQGASLDDWRQDICAAVDQLRERREVKRVAVVGARLGATLAATAGLGQVDRFVMWDPVVDGSRYVGLLEQFHQQSLTSGRYYVVTRTAAPGQLFGSEMSEARLNQLQELRLPEQALVGKERYLITSANYAADEGLVEGSQWQTVLQTNDAVFWHDATYTESAFSAPHVADAIIRCLVKS